MRDTQLPMAESSADEFDDELDPSVFQPPKLSSPPPASSQKLHHPINPEALSTYIYPTNLPVRDYQYNIVYRSFFHNVLVALPTGLGKTFIASTVMLNFWRWFPESKIVFMAPTKPLVAQQIKACLGITGMPPEEVAILLDKTRRNRKDIWDAKRVFFTTPQVVENDLTAGLLDPKSVVLLVVDEAHRAKGNYAYHNVAQFLSRFNRNFRILAMTATPASDVDGVQQVIDNLNISKVEVRTERSIDIYKYLKRKTVDRVTAEVSPEVQQALDLMYQAAGPLLKFANGRGIYDVTDPARINAFTALDASQKLIRNPNVPDGLKWSNVAVLKLLSMVGQCLRRLNNYGIRAFYSFFSEKYAEFSAKSKKSKSKSNLAESFYKHPSIDELLKFCASRVSQPGFLGHRKLEITIDELTNFFQTTSNADSRVIIFTEFRQSALDIVRALEHQSTNLKPHIFIGQAKEKDKFDEENMGSKKGKKGKATKSKAHDSEGQTSSEMAQVTGMNQKMQKEIITKFKKGVYNILVATSIGEEGLDIGEVDLIVCYDSTSSPIKNIQRMGRTGRNRDGKVLLLFSSNEETKFDKAMGGYEYIQQRIMNGDIINLKPPNRIIPADYTPKVVEQFIEIEKENEAIKAEDDEDEIIRIASKYMSGTKAKKSAKASTPKKTEKIQKRFFMPDDVETGFQSASAVMNGESNGEKRQRLNEKDTLDSILDSDSGMEDFPELSTLEKASKAEKTSAASKQRRASPASASDSAKERTPIAAKLESPPSTSQTRIKTAPVAKQPEILNFLSKSGSLGVRKRVSSTPEPKKASTDAKESADELDDDLDIMALAQSTQAVLPVTTGKVSERAAPIMGNSINSNPVHKSEHDSIFQVNEKDGILTDEEQRELYMNYYVPADSSETMELFIPRPTLIKNVRHGSRSAAFLRFHEKLQKQDEVIPQALQDLSPAKIIEFDI